MVFCHKAASEVTYEVTDTGDHPRGPEGFKRWGKNQAKRPRERGAGYEGPPASSFPSKVESYGAVREILHVFQPVGGTATKRATCLRESISPGRASLCQRKIKAAFLILFKDQIKHS